MSRPIAVLLLAPLASALNAADAPKQSALAKTYQDAQLAWGPCPEFIPKGCEITVLHGADAAPGK